MTNQMRATNRVLASIPAREHKRLLAQLEPIELKFGQVLHEPGKSILFGTARLRLLSPLVARASGAETLVSLQTADAGILLAPLEGRGG